MTYKQQGGMASSSVHDDPDTPHVQPAPEHTEGVVFPYRGIENHGVKQDTPIPDYVDDQWPQDDESESYEDGPTEDEPIPVRIVSERAHEYLRFRAFTVAVPSINGQALNQAGLILGRTDPAGTERRVIHIQNQDAAKDLFIGHGNNVSSLNGWRIRANSELSFSLTSEHEIWGASSDGTSIAVGVLVEYSVPL